MKATLNKNKFKQNILFILKIS